MIVQLLVDGQTYSIDLSQPLDLSIELGKARCFYAPDVVIQPYEADGFVGSVKAGAPVNYYNVRLNPHGNGTHTECVGHITKEHQNLGDCYTDGYHHLARLLSVQLSHLPNGDSVIAKENLINAGLKSASKALIIRTLPNSNEKLSKDYSLTNPPYFLDEAMAYLVECGVEHLLVDLPSVDREVDQGKLSTHNLFWNTAGILRKHCTITELIFVPDDVQDGQYLLNLQTIPLALDAVPSRPLLYRMY
jgi:arylformamidase